ncbi:MAG: 2-isopropylmalate synthase [Clostridiaceae bacterium]|nr:2-isopropylmalate synthase [Clostridiaceae bacterium]
MNYYRYKKGYQPIPKFNRTWPDKEITKAPKWCSVDLRDGNQALITPMNLEEKLKFFDFLVKLGFKEIEVGFPAASETEFTFVRKLIDDNLIPLDVTIQVLTQSRPHIIEKTVEAVRGAKNVIIHLYNSTSPLQREVVFGMTKEEVIKLAEDGARLLLELTKDIKDNVRFEYSPESFTGTEVEFAAEICNRVLDIWKPTKDKKAIINLPATIEVSTPNIYADQIEYMCQNLKYRDCIEVSLHTHNDRGCAVAASELGLLAGADRIEGTLFGNGERTGNADILTIALNMFSQGIDPGLELSNITEIVQIYEEVTKFKVHPRQPYAGELVYTAFSGSHQDAIKKSLDKMEKEKSPYWENPYLPIDPKDLGREYEPIRINSQSGKGGIMYVLKYKFGMTVPKNLAQEFSYIITSISDKLNRELTHNEIYEAFCENYVNLTTRFELLKYKLTTSEDVTQTTASVKILGKEVEISGKGNGPIEAFVNALRNAGLSFDITLYEEHALTEGAGSKACAYMGIKDEEGNISYGVGIHENIGKASCLALISALNRSKIK